MTRSRSTKLGGFRALKRGTPSPFHDVYYSAMELSWPAFIACISLIFLLINAGFGLVYAAIPGALLNATDGSFLDGFFFSVETLATVGYGSMAPANYTAHSVTVIEIMCGILLTATTTGLTFARFARPRESILFSNVAIVGDYDGREALMVRIASLRPQPIAELTAQMGLVERLERKDGHFSRGLTNLPLVRAENAMLTMTWTIAHILEPDSALRRALRAGEDTRILVTVAGLDTMLATQTFGGRLYLAEEILVDHDFVDMINEIRPGEFEVDLSRLHSARPRQPEASNGTTLRGDKGPA